MNFFYIMASFEIENLLEFYNKKMRELDVYNGTLAAEEIPL